MVWKGRCGQEGGQKRKGKREGRGGRVENQEIAVARVGDEGRDEGREGCFSHLLLTTSSVQCRDKREGRR